MSGAPTKGMVAGKPIKTGDASKEYDEGHARTFGDRKAERGRWVYTDRGQPLSEPIWVSEDWANPGHETGRRSDAEIYNNLRATDGTPIDSRTKHRNYMKANGLAMTEDFKEHFKKAEKRREEVLSGNADSKERREVIGRALHEARNGRFKPSKIGALDDE
jgi:hypothetical protein